MTLVWRPGFQFDNDAANYIEAVELADGQTLEARVRYAINDFVVGCKTDGIWSAIKASCILAGARTLNGALVPLVGTAPTNVNFVAGDYSRKTGLVGNGSTKYLNSNRAGNADPQNSFHLLAFASVAATSVSGRFPVYIGNSGTNSRNIYRADSNGGLFGQSNSGALTISAGAGGAIGAMGIARFNSVLSEMRSSGIAYSSNISSSAPLSDFIGVFGSPGANLGITYSNARLAFYSIGESLDLALLDARVTGLINTFATIIP